MGTVGPVMKEANGYWRDKYNEEHDTYIPQLLTEYYSVGLFK
jgi:hypothetical protein